MRTNIHYYKNYEIRNVKRLMKLKHSVFHIIPNCGREGEDPIDATRTLRAARHLIDVWSETMTCACGQFPLPHEYRCWKCLSARLNSSGHRSLIKRRA